MRLHISAEIAAADWLRPLLRPFGSGVAAIVPSGFPAYARILHPALGRNGEHVRWDVIAARSSRIMHRLAQFHRIVASRTPIKPGSVPWDGMDPPQGDLPVELLRVLCAILVRHTRSCAACWFCVWEGYGWLNGSTAVAAATYNPDGRQISNAVSGLNAFAAPVFPAEVDTPRVNLPNRGYFLLEGPLDAATDLGWTVGDAFFPQSPNLFWPQDHAWCVASEIDLCCTLVAGSQDMVEGLVADSRLEAWRVEPDDSIAYDGDQINS